MNVFGYIHDLFVPVAEADPRLVELLEEQEKIQGERKAATEEFAEAIKDHVNKGQIVPFRRAK